MRPTTAHKYFKSDMIASQVTELLQITARLSFTPNFSVLLIASFC